MSNSHATAYASDHQIPSAFGTAVEVAATLRATIRAFTMLMIAAIQQRFMERRLTRLSDHMLRDLGYEHDWDGSIRSLPDRC